MQRAAIFCLRRHAEVGLSPGPNGAGTKLTGYHLMTLIHLLILWKTKLDHWFGSYDVLK